MGEDDKEYGMKEGSYYYKKHGLLFIVYQKVFVDWCFIAQEDSRWYDEKLAAEHCRLLNRIKT